MKKIILILVIFAFMPLSGLSQQKEANDSGRERLRAMKVAYFTEKIGLTPSESEKFWPIYNQYWKERREIAHRFRDIFDRVEKGLQNGAELETMFEVRDAENATIRRWAVEFKKTISPEKVIKIFVAEETFKHYLLKQRQPQK